MNLGTDIGGFLGATALAVFGGGELEGTVVEVIPHHPQRRMALGHQFNLSFFRLRLANGYSVLVGGVWISNIDRAYEEGALVTEPITR